MPLYNSEENQRMSSLEESYRQMKIQEVANYQPPPMAQAPPAQIKQSNQPAPEARKAPTAGQKAPAAKNKSYFNPGSNLAGKMGMKAGGDVASVIVDHDRGVVHRQNDGYPYLIHRSTVTPTWDGERFTAVKEHDATNSLTDSDEFYKAYDDARKNPSNSNAYYGQAIEKDAFGKSQGFMDDINKTTGQTYEQLRKSNPEVAAAIVNYEESIADGNHIDYNKGGPGDEDTTYLKDSSRSDGYGGIIDHTEGDTEGWNVTKGKGY